MPNDIYHIPALLSETIDALNIRPNGIYADVTFGGGGHSREIMKHLGSEGQLYSFDQDEDAYNNRIEDSRFQFVHSNFRYIRNFMRYYGVDQIDGVLADLGVSFHHFDTAERGFSFRFEGPLDMRMNRQGTKTATDIVNTYDEDRLCSLLRLYGEVRNARPMARAIVKERTRNAITRTEELTQLLSPLCGRDAEKKELARVFQALRIEVNDEMSALTEMLDATKDLLKPGGRIVILTYHSLEDRIVKNFLRSGNPEGITEKDFYGNLLTPFRLINNKVITASTEEVERNPRSRSAKLRAAEKK
ncbi:MAG: 16S rRNA (cytosine(1402)-N(4))-methyltransferase RsmH [Paludibacter sp.]|nr:16S rRNA (cytosine(1402)-N(4))-methyltransferase RsmH [Bacteroidales bacterium]MCM1068355.1 16S rRNA (cytosine(1402)-N(4))-methyltransferase RsmH [Prevotella sp.]MCM1354017.1 16S rRNA (cytosine(1402)-N(4))-methyltransferase RsmH [Bacteroides sp.]MCM1442141.1 16S rRNA (cytosine(1402)-N(4))-methyltransferase RsmH [Muribaculum sp.]MCM1481966.1 16S rRNA (cytosine(1402)-N(4))-methyltransferase RsmH [Paludibacter sp.]